MANCAGADCQQNAWKLMVNFIGADRHRSVQGFVFFQSIENGTRQNV